MNRSLNSESSAVVLTEHPLAGGFLLAEARLNSEATLNALSLDMIDILDPALRRWKDSETVVAVLLTSSGNRAFSAGGDIQALYRAMVRNHQAGERVDEYPYEFFEREYRLDYLLHRYTKPVIALGHGVIMGGGLGIFSAARFRIVSERVRIAMPEVTIGLFPDAGGTWLLRGLAPHIGRFVGMTGSHLNAADALDIGLGTHNLSTGAFDLFIGKLASLAWRGEPEADGALIDACLGQLPSAELAGSQLPLIPESLGAAEELGGVVESLRALAGVDPWIDRGLANLNGGCPTTVGIVFEQLRRAPALDLADCFRLEMTVATHCADNHDFAEGVRALLIEKDNNPTWQFGDLESLPDAYVQSHFAEPWARNPLHDLERTL